MPPHPVLRLLPAVLALCFASAAPGQGWLDAVKNKATQTLEKGLESSEDQKDEAPPADQQRKSGKKADASAGASGPAADVGGQPNLTAVKSDFVPGEKTIFYDDFTDMAGDEPPPHWKVRGGMAELRTGGNVRQLTMTRGDIVLTPNLKTFPQNFTMEADITLASLSGNGGRVSWHFMAKDGWQSLEIVLFAQDSDEDHGVSTEVLVGDQTQNIENIGSARPALDWRKPMQQALWLQDGRIRLYMNGTRLIDVNQVSVDMSKVAYVEFRQDMNNSPEGVVGLRRVRFAESTPDFSKVIASAGRYVTHGILFDADSDRIKAESAAVIKSIARGLETNPNLKLLIEGHTDSTGDAAHNLDLSKRRAEAVKAVLVSQLGVDPSRLTTAGLGATRPIDSNDTPQGRAQNRRVELVRQ